QLIDIRHTWMTRALNSPDLAGSPASPIMKPLGGRRPRYASFITARSKGMAREAGKRLAFEHRPQHAGCKTRTRLQSAIAWLLMRSPEASGGAIPAQRHSFAPCGIASSRA